LPSFGSFGLIRSRAVVRSASGQRVRSIASAEFGLALTGIGMGIASGPLFDIAISAVPAARSGTASAVINVARMAGATVGVAILGAIFSIAQGGFSGLRIAMVVGGVVQLVGALTAWTLQRPSRA
jgi:DHA2 family methylenomycin A resistance protein-like MFS transporter